MHIVYAVWIDADHSAGCLRVTYPSKVLRGLSGPLLNSRPMDRTMERWKRLLMVVALLLAGGIFIALYAQFQQLLLHPFAWIGAVVLSLAFSLIILRVALVPEQRHTGWVKTIVGPNGRWLFLSRSLEVLHIGPG